MCKFYSKTEEKCFPNVTAAYIYYLLYYADVTEHHYYNECYHTWLDDVKDEKAMEEIFRNIFNKAWIKVID